MSRVASYPSRLRNNPQDFFPWDAADSSEARFDQKLSPSDFSLFSVTLW